MHESIDLPSSQSLQKVETVTLSDQTEFVFFDQLIDFVAPRTQILLSLFVDPNGDGHLQKLRGVAIQVDSDTGMVLDTLRKGQPVGQLDGPLAGHSRVKLCIHMQQHGGVSIPHLAISNDSGSLGQCQLDLPTFRDNETMILPAFYARGGERVSAFIGYYTEDILEPVFTDHSICLWPDDAPMDLVQDTNGNSL